MTVVPAPSRRTPVVVIADDDSDIRALVELAARRAGAVVAASVGDGVTATTAIREHLPDLAILDVAMPGRTGLQVCRDARSDPALGHLRVLLLSAAVQPEAVAAGLAAGADEYATKPFSPRTLADRIRALLAAGRGVAVQAR